MVLCIFRRLFVFCRFRFDRGGRFGSGFGILVRLFAFRVIRCNYRLDHFRYINFLGRGIGEFIEHEKQAVIRRDTGFRIADCIVGEQIHRGAAVHVLHHPDRTGLGALVLERGLQRHETHILVQQLLDEIVVHFVGIFPEGRLYQSVQYGVAGRIAGSEIEGIELEDGVEHVVGPHVQLGRPFARAGLDAVGCILHREHHQRTLLFRRGGLDLFVEQLLDTLDQGPLTRVLVLQTVQFDVYAPFIHVDTSFLARKFIMFADFDGFLDKKF